MLRKKCCYLFCLALSVVCALGLTSTALGQSGSQGTVIVTVTDASGAVIPDANLELVEASTNSLRKAETASDGSHRFVNLTIGVYKLSISKTGYASKVYSSVLVQASQVSSIAAALPVGEVSEVVSVTGTRTPVLQVSSNEIGTVVDMKQIQNLPLEGRDLTSFSTLVAGYNGTFNGLPSNDQGSNIDGVIGSSSRMKFSGNTQPAVSPRLENIEEMSIQTDQLSLNSGFGQSSTQLNFVSKRGSNRFHGSVYEDFRNSGLNANSWFNNAAGVRKNKLILNDFGGNFGGPIFHDKLFFFGSFAMSKQPGSFTASNDVFTTAAQQGNFTYSGGMVNVLNVVNASNPSLPGTVNSQQSAQLAAINDAVSHGAVTGTADPNYNQISWNNNSSITNYFPGGRLDYVLSDRVRMYLSFLYNKNNQPTSSAANFPGSGFAYQVAGSSTKNYTTSYGLDFIITPRLINQLKLGYLYDNTQYAPGVKPSYATLPTVAWAFGNSTGTMSGQSYPLPITTFYPILNASDSVTWEKGSHAISFGASWYREQDHYYNPPEGFPNYSLGLASGDPALNAFNTSNFPGASANDLVEAEQLYAILTGRISNVNGQFAKNPHDNTYETGVGAYNLDEVSSAAGLFAEDSWKVRRDLTLNYGLRWDFVGDQHDLTGAYHSASPGDIYGPSGYGNLFNPGSLKGNMNPVLTANEHAYAPWKVTPQPAFGFSWNPTVSEGPLGALLGGSSTVIRGGFALRRFTEPYQYYWNQASDYGSFFYQNFSLNPNNTGTTGTFTPGSLSLGQALPPYAIAPAAYEVTAQQAEFTFISGAPGVNGIDPHIKQPYSESWNFGVQRALGSSRVLEVRYNGNRSIHQWIAINPNEVNVFENGFLAEFKKAQANLAANGGPNAANPSFAGSGMPIITAAFGGSANDSDFSNGQFIQYLVNGDVGSFANTLSGVNGTHPYFCNLVGSKFAPCVTNAGVTTAGAGYPINFFQSNPYAAGTQTGYMTAAGYSNYNGLQVEFRQASWKGLQFDANYTYSKSLGISTPQSWTGSLNVFTLRNLRQSYGPSQFDLTHVTHIHGTYDLPFGHGKSFLSNNAIADKVAGGWTVGTILTFQTGYPFALTGGNQTFNDYGDGGVNLSGVTSEQLQKAIGVHRIPGQTFVTLIDPKYLASATGGGANATYISPNTTPGTIGRVVYLHGPHGFYDDVSVTKTVPIRREMNFRIQAEFLNAFNHPVFGNSSSQTSAAGSINSSVQSNSFGLGGISNSSRLIELRANVDF
jgi:hypothetical protein